jgi:hypothetical protein
MSNQNLAAIADIWNLVSEYLTEDDRIHLADNVVTMLMDYDYHLDDIRHEFDGNSEIMDAVKFYSENEDIYEEDDTYDELDFGNDEYEE